MSKYFRTKDGRIIDLNSKLVSSYEIIDDNTAKEEYGEDNGFICVYYFDEDIGEHIEYDNKGGRSMDNWFLKDIIKEADTIEELSDEFRGVWINYFESEKKDAHEEYHYDKEKDVFCDDFEELTHKEAVEKFDIFYAAIWTEWGLRYVAKMKEILPNGEIDWELV